MPPKAKPACKKVKDAAVLLPVQRKSEDGKTLQRATNGCRDTSAGVGIQAAPHVHFVSKAPKKVKKVKKEK